MKKIQDLAALLFIAAVALLSTVAVLGVWDFFTGDVIVKSFETLGLLAVAAVIVIVAGHFIGHGTAVTPELPNPFFHQLRKGTIGIVIVSVSILALLGVLAIWDVIADKQVLYRSFISLLIVAFGAFIMVLTCLEREGGEAPQGEHKGFSGGVIVAIVLGLLVLLPTLLSMSSFLFR